MRELERRLKLVEAGCEARHRYHLLAELEPVWRFIHVYLSSGDESFLTPLPPALRPAREDTFGVDLDDDTDPRIREVQSWSDNQLRAALLPEQAEYAQWAGPMFGRPGWEPRFWDYVRQLLGQSQATAAELREMLNTLDERDLIAMAREA